MYTVGIMNSVFLLLVGLAAGGRFCLVAGGTAPYEIEVQWVLQGREFSFTGFFLEFLGVSSAFRDRLPQMRLMQSSYSYFYNETALSNRHLLDLLFEKEVTNLQWLYSTEYNEYRTASFGDATVSTGGELQVGDDVCVDEAEFRLDPASATLTDMWRPDVSLASTAAECCRVCTSTPLCIGWSMTRFAQSEGLRCQLKGSLLKHATDQDLAAMLERPREDVQSRSHLLSPMNPRGIVQKPR